MTMNRANALKGGDLRQLPLYSVNEAARYLKLPPATLRSWGMGREYDTKAGRAHFEHLIDLPDPSIARLSFYNLVEAHILKSLRTKHAVEIKAIRSAIDYAEGKMNVRRLLIRDELRTAAGHLFWDKFNELINLSKSGQVAMREMFESYLERIERDVSHLPIRLYPFIPSERTERTVVIDPYISFGRPTISGKGITTAVIVQRVDAGESVPELADDYGLEESEIRDAIVYEKAA